MAPVKASEWKDKTFQGQRDLFYQQNPNPYELGVGFFKPASTATQLLWQQAVSWLWLVVVCPVTPRVLW
jgi:hypothetical protein